MADNPPVLAPVHLAGADAIATAFRVRRDEVLSWAAAGAPISRDPRTGRYDGEYNRIQVWREAAYPAKDEKNR